MAGAPKAPVVQAEVVADLVAQHLGDFLGDLGGSAAALDVGAVQDDPGRRAVPALPYVEAEKARGAQTSRLAARARAHGDLDAG
jgi:hypothetical protein